MRSMHHFVTVMALTVSMLTIAEEVNVSIPSLDRTKEGPLLLPGFWFTVKTSEKAPAILMLHGCGGPYNRSGKLSVRMKNYAKLLNDEGFHVLVTDSLTPRGERELCTQKSGQRKLTQQNRRRDALGALQWLSRQTGVDGRRLVLLGWSNGGSTVLAATNMNHPEVRDALVHPARAVSFYPGCREELKRKYRPTAPLLLLLGAADDWTPPESCLLLAERSSEPKPEVELYPGAFHGFDSTSELTLRRDVPNGIKPGQGVHVGRNEKAADLSQERLLSFLRTLTLAPQVL
jgi:dienelactone hydrolase